jgi:hypothetical protein
VSQLLRDNDAAAHPAYNGGVRYAAERAMRDKGACFSVYWDGEAIYVRASEAIKPENSKLVCIAQYWGEQETAHGKTHTVQLRFDGARSEWVNF